MLVTRLRLALVVFVAFMLQITLFVDIHPLGVAPELPLLVAIHAGRSAGPDRGAAVGFAVGLLYDLELSTPFGLWALTCCLVAFGMGVIGETLHRPGGVLASISTGIASVGGVVTFAVLGGILGQAGMVSSDLPRIALLVGVLNLVLSPLVGLALRWAYRPSGTLWATS
jgi:rod shape-determining protein MreD